MVCSGSEKLKAKTVVGDGDSVESGEMSDLEEKRQQNIRCNAMAWNEISKVCEAKIIYDMQIWYLTCSYTSTYRETSLVMKM